MIRVNVENRDNFEITLKRFSKTCQREGIISEIKKREFFEKPSSVRRRQKRERVRNIRRIERLRGLRRRKD
ncbi:MAG: 30S ribosomal protein S21 [Planctomycetota bacterium]|nr:30S ribosomal protein S21 [Planctomycetota bacterium]MDP6360049.1 30S ribosomal protein S21 [Planctomycetota bacterium]MDP7128958.1 30S ribosomal protein S21 [Planctomycetota bacterium]MDP7248237.1 30S ribosomal protein S21 [Planctomycetota bacterium]